MINSMNKCHESAFQSWKWQTGSTTSRSEEPERNPFEVGKPSQRGGICWFLEGGRFRPVGFQPTPAFSGRPFVGEPCHRAHGTVSGSSGARGHGSGDWRAWSLILQKPEHPAGEAGLPSAGRGHSGNISEKYN